jgi:uncharacterized protein (UPF0332 family)
MLVQEHVQTAREFLEAADGEFAAGDMVRGSEKMWGAASHAVMAVAQQQGWPFGSHRALKNAVERFVVEHSDPAIRSGFLAAEKFHRNFYHDYMEDFELDADRPVVRDFVTRVLALVD